MTRICFFSGVISRSGGTERVGSIIANELSDRGFTVFLISLWDQGEPYYYLNPSVKVSYLMENKFEGKLYNTWLYPILKLRYFLVRNNIDIIIDIDSVLTNQSAYAVSGTKCKVISWEHFNYWTLSKLNERKRFTAKELIKKNNIKQVVLTEEDREAHIKFLGFDKNQIVSIPNPITFISNENYRFESHTFISAGRLVPEKGFDNLIKAWKLVESKTEGWNLLIAGRGTEEYRLQELVKSYDLKRIQFLGHVKDINSILSNSSCYVLSSRFEGFPMVLLEAAANGLPIISFDCKTGPRDIVIDNVTGYLIDDQNIESLAKKMIDFTQNKEIAKNMSKETKIQVKKFDISEVGNKWENLIKELKTNC